MVKFFECEKSSLEKKFQIKYLIKYPNYLIKYLIKHPIIVYICTMYY